MKVLEVSIEFVCKVMGVDEQRLTGHRSAPAKELNQKGFFVWAFIVRLRDNPYEFGYKCTYNFLAKFFNILG